MKFQLGSVVYTRPFSCLPYTFSIDWAAGIRGWGWMVLPDSASQRSCSQGNSVSNQHWTGFGFLSCLTMSNSFRQDEGEQGCFKEEMEKGEAQKESGECWRQTLQLNSSISSLSPEAMDFFSLFCPWPQRGHGFNHYATQASQELWFYGAFTMHQMWSWPPTCLSSCAWHKGAFQGCEWGWQPAKLCLPSPGHEAYTWKG